MKGKISIVLQLIGILLFLIGSFSLKNCNPLQFLVARTTDLIEKSLINLLIKEKLHSCILL
jgi:hypothetical protein